LVKNTKSAPAEPVVKPKKSGLSTFEGVFTPSILTILGVIMYLRFGWVVGNVGLIGTIIIVTLSTLITFLTSLSIASIATDQRVRIGGAYYMISRSLGIESGGAIGIPLYFAQALSVALYTIGFAESVVGVFGHLNEKIVGLLVTALVGGLALLSTKIAIRSQFFVMAAIAISLLSLIFGKPLENSEIEMWGARPANSENFWVVFAVFFPAVTGIMAGVNLSGDLEKPKKAIPIGTFAAVGTGYLIYMLLPLILASRADATTLIDDPLIMRKISFWGDAILLGVWGATLSSAMGSMLGAPRVLQALARDGVLPKPFRWLGKGSGEEDAPKIGTIFTLAIALVAVYMGDLNLIAPVLSMFFLTTYGVLNIAAGLEKILGSPSFRPTFKVHWVFSIVGAIGCIAVMFLINAAATVVAGIFVFLVFIWLQNRQLRTAWGDVRQGLWLGLIRMGLARLKPSAEPKNWRPHLLVLSGAPTKRWPLIDISNAITQGKALMTVSTILKSDEVTLKRKQTMELNIREFLIKRGINSLVRVTSAPNPFVGAETLVENYGMGHLVPNTVVLGHSEEMASKADYCRMINHFYQANRNVLILRDRGDEPFAVKKRIDIWWGGLNKNGGLMIILGHLLRSSVAWRSAQIKIKMVIPNKEAASDAEKNISGILHSMRIDAKYDIIINEGRPFEDLLRENSSRANLVFLGMAKPDENFQSYYENLMQKTKGLPSTMFVLATQETAFGEVLK